MNEHKKNEYDSSLLIHHHPEKKAVYDSMKEYFETIGKLKRDIDETDREIDQMVYRLYDLSEEEIRIVEKVEKT